jgi:hypothetical protein
MGVQSALSLPLMLGEQVIGAINRALVNQAIGIIRDRSGASAEQALDQLVRISNSMNTN